MNDTPESDKKSSPHIGFYSCATVPAEFARKLERERNLATEQWELCIEHSRKLERERNEAQSTLTDIHRWIERNHPDGFIDSLSYSQNLERVTDRWYDSLETVERERDKYKNAILECLEKNCHLADGEDCTLIGLKKALQ